jgi:hypothetical protein
LSSGTGINTFNAEDVFDTITPISGTVFSENFTASGTNWTHAGGTTTYTNGYMSQAQSSSDYTTSSYDIGKYWEVKCRVWANEHQQGQSCSNTL